MIGEALGGGSFLTAWALGFAWRRSLRADWGELDTAEAEWRRRHDNANLRPALRLLLDAYEAHRGELRQRVLRLTHNDYVPSDWTTPEERMAYHEQVLVRLEQVGATPRGFAYGLNEVDHRSPLDAAREPIRMVADSEISKGRLVRSGRAARWMIRLGDFTLFGSAIGALLLVAHTYLGGMPPNQIAVLVVIGALIVAFLCYTLHALSLGSAKRHLNKRGGR